MSRHAFHSEDEEVLGMSEPSDSSSRSRERYEPSLRTEETLCNDGLVRALSSDSVFV